MSASAQDSFCACVTLQRGGFGILIYFCGCIASILMTRVDELLATANYNALQIFEQKNLSQNNAKINALVIWQWLSTIRAVCALFGWFLFALQPSSNYTHKHMKNFMVN